MTVVAFPILKRCLLNGINDVVSFKREIICRFKKQQLKVLLLVVSIFIEKIKEFTHIYLYWKYFIDFEIHV